MKFDKNQINSEKQQVLSRKPQFKLKQLKQLTEGFRTICKPFKSFKMFYKYFN